MSGHEKKRLPRGVDLEKRRYIGFAKQPVVDESRVLIDKNAEPKNRFWYPPSPLDPECRR